MNRETCKGPETSIWAAELEKLNPFLWSLDEHWLGARDMSGYHFALTPPGTSFSDGGSGASFHLPKTEYIFLYLRMTLGGV